MEPDHHDASALRALFDEHLSPSRAGDPPTTAELERRARLRRRRRNLVRAAAVTGALGGIAIAALIGGTDAPPSYAPSVSPAVSELPPLDVPAFAGLSQLLLAAQAGEGAP